MSEKKRQKKDGENKDNRNDVMRTETVKPGREQTDFPKQERNPGQSRSGGPRQQ